MHSILLSHASKKKKIFEIMIDFPPSHSLSKHNTSQKGGMLKMRRNSAFFLYVLVLMLANNNYNAFVDAADTKTVTLTMSKSRSASMSVSLPTGTASFSSSLSYSTSLTLPSATGSSTLSKSMSKSLTASLTESKTPTLTRTATFVYYNNYSYALSTLDFTEGQEVRLRVSSKFDDTFLDAFNISDLGTVQVKGFAYSTTYKLDCPLYAVDTTATVLFSSNRFGLSMEDSQQGDRFTGHAHVTFVAPAASERFVICFRHILPAGSIHRKDDRIDKWLTVDTPSPDNNIVDTALSVFAAKASKRWYHIPAATSAQYAVVQLFGEGDVDFTYPSTACGEKGVPENLLPCGSGDNLKIVPANEPCTYEHQNYLPYYGSGYVEADGSWNRTAVEGLLEGSTPGGVGRFGPQYANPLVDSWSAPGDFLSANARHTTSYGWKYHHHAYAYVRLPSEVGKEYDICYSSLLERQRIWNQTIGIERYNGTVIDSKPVWRKLFRCTDPTDCAAETVHTTSFKVLAEEVQWSLPDLSPLTWGTLRFEDTVYSRLNSLPATNPVRAGTTKMVSGVSTSYVECTSCTYPTPPLDGLNYFEQKGGDMFRIVPASSFGETALIRSSPNDDPPLGSFPSKGCWDTSLDKVTSGIGGMDGDLAPFPVGSTDLSGDPMDKKPNDDVGITPTTFSSVYLGAEASEWYVCYRKADTPYAGFRVAPWQKVLPDRWTHLDTLYTPASRATPQPLVPSNYGNGLHLMPAGTAPITPPPPASVWYMNDTREDTYGPMTVEVITPTLTASLDRRKFTTNSTGIPSLKSAVGSQLRIISESLPCDALSYRGKPPPGPKSDDGGAFECAGSGMTNDTTHCLGSAADQSNSDSVSFYVQVPLMETAGYRVCFRQGAWNWQQLSPTTNNFRRGGWYMPSGEVNLFPSQNPISRGEISLLNLETRGGMEALFIVSDTKAGLTAAGPTNTTSGDILRIVRHNESCDLNPVNWKRGTHATDLHLSLYCKVDGVGKLSLSGLADQSAPCGYAPSSRNTFCHGAPCPKALTNYTGPLIQMVSQVPDVYDDIAPYDQDYSNHLSVAASVVLPPDASLLPHKICYKQVALANWLIFNDTYLVTPPQQFTLTSPPKGQMLLAGELQKFSMRYAAPMGRSQILGSMSPNITHFYAKLVRKSKHANDNCLNPAAGTEGVRGAAFTRKHRMGGSDHHIDFRLIVPHTLGEHWLCVQAQFSPDDALSWYRHPKPLMVFDNGVRWFVTPGQEPMNQGVTTLDFMRCATTIVNKKEVCERKLSKDVFDTSPGMDAAKIVSSHEACHAGKLHFEEVLDHGSSNHIALEGVVNKVGARGMDDLGPADGPSDTASIKVTFPAPPFHVDTHTVYKACVKTTFTIDGARRVAWVEVKQAAYLPEQVMLTDSFRQPALITRPSLVSHWNIHPILRPTTVLVDPMVMGKPEYRSAVGLGGAATAFVSGHNTSTPGISDANGGWGFTFRKYTTGDKNKFGNKHGNSFKLVQIMKALARYPPNAMNGTGWLWETIAGASCDTSPAVDSTSNLQACTSNSQPGECPSLTDAVQNDVRAKFHLPIDPGAYMVCYRVAADLPWLWLRNGDSGSNFLFTQPSFLEFDATVPWNVTFFDLRMAASPDGSDASPMSSWCSIDQKQDEGVPCFGQNSAGDSTQVTGFFTDLISVVPDVQVCTRPPKPASYLEPPTGWHNLIRVGNSSAKIWDTWGVLVSRKFSLPTTGRYKLCLYKAGDAKYGISTDRIPDNGTVANGGVMYQLYNRIVEVGYYTESLKVTRFEVEYLEPYNTSRRFAAFDPKVTQLQYENTELALITEPSGQVSYTPVYRSGSIIGLTVLAATTQGRVPFGNYAVWVEQCKTPKSWLDLSCTTSYKVPTEYLIENTIGACSAAMSTDYGWSATGLKQFLSSGMVLFKLQYKSACKRDLSDSQWGCGIRIAGIPTGDQLPVYSDPVWVNIENHYPDEVQIDSVEVLSAIPPIQPKQAFGCTATNPQCYLKTCYHGEKCTIHIQARYGGPVEYAAKGSFSVKYSLLDYNGIWKGIPAALATDFQPLSWAEVMGQKWMPGGQYDFTVYPHLIADRTSSTVYLNVSYGLNDFHIPQGNGLWVRLAVQVVRREPTDIRLVDVAPMDLYGLSGVSTALPPTDVWNADNRNTTFPEPNSVLRAMEGSYIQSLIPYEATYQVCVDNAVPCTSLPASAGAPLGPWLLSASVLGQADNKVLFTWHTQNKQGVPTFTQDNLRTSPAYTGNVLTGAYPDNMGSGTTFRIWFRVLNNLGCSRFNTPSGCSIEFLFERGSTKLRAVLQTPVRVVAQTLRVEGVGGSALVPVAPITNGITVTVLPGTPMGGFWFPDEFHYGDIFVLIGSPAPADGVFNRDGVSLLKGTGPMLFRNGSVTCNHYNAMSRCDVFRYSTMRIGNQWGAQWDMRTSQPCHNCDFTFHSTWGASPLSAQQEYGLASLTFTDDTAALQCTLDPEALTKGVAMPPGRTTSDTFEVTVSPLNSKGKNVPWPRWWVYTDLTKDVAVLKVPLTEPRMRHQILIRSVLTAKMVATPDGRTQAVFTRLLFEGIPPTALETPVDVTFHSVGTVYNPAFPGSIAKGTTHRSCTTTVKLKGGSVTEPPSFMKIVSVVGATPLCAVAEGCDKWQSTTDTTTLLVTVWVYKKPTTLKGKETVDLRDRNITVKSPAGATTPVAWNCVSRSAPCTTDPMKITSPHADWQGKGDGNDPYLTYSYGAPSVRLVRARDAAGVSGAGGQGVITITQLGTPATRPPVREGNISICATVNGSSSLVDNPAAWFQGNPCASITLWLLPPSSASVKTAIVNVVGATVLEPGTQDCGRKATPLSFTALAYYAIQNDILRYVVYEKPLRFAVSTPAVGTQKANLLVEVSNPVISNTVVTVTNALPARVSIIDSLLNKTYDPFGYISVYGLEERVAAVQIEITAENLLSPNELITPLSTTSAYRWSRSTMTPYSVWNILDTVEDDSECPRKRKFTITDKNFRSYATVPAQGWSYTKHGAVAGIPFPIQAIVKTSTINGIAVSPAERAWTFQSSLVTARKRMWSGCNDGGYLIVHEMTPSKRLGGSLLLPTTIDAAFQQPSIADTVRTNQGVATLWLELTEPCQQCTIELSLCYTGANSVKDCFADPAGDLNQSPPFAERTKLTKPFTTRKPQANTVHVLEQSAPKPALDGTISVGEFFTASFESVQKFGKWSVPVKSTYRVWVASKWVHPQKGDALVSGIVKYGNGGFVSAGLVGKGIKCGVQSEDMLLATRKGATLLGQTNVLKFFFTRPCSNCEIWFHYEIDDTNGLLQHWGSFPQRSVSIKGVATVGDVLLFRVVTCGEIWLLAGIPPVSVRRRRAFSLTAWRVDANHNPSWLGSDLASLSLDQTASQGNGGGGSMVVTSPVDKQQQTTAANGTATVRMYFTRACYSCVVRFAVKAHEFTVLTDATQLMVIPMNMTNHTMMLTATQTTAVWSFGLYAADDLGDRSFLVGGPSALAWRRLYSEPVKSPVMTVRATPLPYNVADVSSFMLNGRRIDFTLPQTKPTIDLIAGHILQDGIPTDIGGAVHPGVVTIAVTGDPSPAFLPQVVFNKMSLPMRTLSGGMPPVLKWAVPPTRYVTTMPGVVNIKQGDPYNVTVFTLGIKPGVELLNSTYYLSVTDPPSGQGVTLTVDCSRECPDCHILLPETPPQNNTAVSFSYTTFKNGRADFKVRIRDIGDRQSVKCDVEVSSSAPEFANADAQKATLSVITVGLSKWTYSSTKLVKIKGTRRDLLVSTTAVYNETMSLELQVWDSSYSDASSVISPSNLFSNLGLDLNPPGCFVCLEANCPPVVLGNAVTPPFQTRLALVGHFTSINNATSCKIQGMKNLPSPTDLLQTLEVAIQRPTGIRVQKWSAPDGSLLNFTDLHAKTGFGKPAMIAGRGSALSIAVVDKDGLVVHGDHKTVVAVDGMRSWGNTTERFNLTLTVKNGVAVFPLNLDPTIAPDCYTVDNSTNSLGACRHFNWTFSAKATLGGLKLTGVTNIITNPSKNYMTSLFGIGPLYVVRSADRLVVEINTTPFNDPAYDAGWQPLRDFSYDDDDADDIDLEMGPKDVDSDSISKPHPTLNKRTPFNWVWGYPYYLRITALDTYTPRPCSAFQIPEQCLIHVGCTWGTVCEGSVATQPLDPEDGGYDSYVFLKPVAVPCDVYDQDLQFLSKGCQEGGSCTYSRVPQCGMNGFVSQGTTLSQNQEIHLQQGTQTIGPLEYVGLDSNTVDRHSQFTLASPALFQEPKGNMLQTPDVFTATVNFQKINRFNFEGANVSCGNAVCTLPTTVFTPIGRHLNPLKPTEITNFPRAPVFTPFDLTFTINDKNGAVITGDDVTVLKLNIVCNFGSRGFSMGVLSGLKTEMISWPTGWDTKKVQGGRVVFKGLGFGGLCSNATLNVTCSTSRDLDPHTTCTYVSMRGDHFEVGDSSVAAPTPLPTPVPVDTSGLPRLVFGIGAVDLGTFGNAEKASFEKTILSDMTRESGREISVYLRYACSLSVADAEVGITLAHKADANICKQWDRPATAVVNRDADELAAKPVICVSSCTSLV